MSSNKGTKLVSYLLAWSYVTQNSVLFASLNVVHLKFACFLSIRVC